jgi:hypothetical protein
MQGIFELDSNFSVPKSFNLDILDNLEVKKHIYGQPKDEDPSYVYWLEYQPYKEYSGTISFARRLYLDYPEVANYVKDYLSSLFPEIPFDIRRVNLIKTTGSISPHTDESLRRCSINIGLKNSSSAITRTSNTKDYNIFGEVAIDNVCQDGTAYLLDTSSIHEVVSADPSINRYLFTYGFGRSFEEILKFYKNADRFKT